MKKRTPEWVEPVEAFTEVAHEPGSVLLESQSGGGYSAIYTEPFEVLDSGSPFDALKEALARRGSGGAVGYLGYELHRFLEDSPISTADDIGLPDHWLGLYDKAIVFDHHPHTAGYSIGNTPAKADLISSFSKPDYIQAVERVKEHIAAGDVYQVNLSQRFSVRMEMDPWELYLLLRERNPAPYAAYINAGDFQIISSSPECFLTFDPISRVVTTRPIKGTRPRSADPAEDRRLAQELESSAKDMAENIMIVDLERNDLGRVCEFGSVSVPELAMIESYPTVHHLVSTVTGRLRDDCDAVDLLTATFPGGSITGAPKIRVMEIIAELEPVRRGVYTGSIGCLGFDGSVNLNIAIRTAVVKDGMCHFHVGGGIVADSDPEAEYQETLDKGRAFLEVLGCQM
ncbi:MAG TPA: aminodeoxychorismate synthase component I [Armatimonadota bacterium]|nr:aminodeoxychorismate synthase component I [Armatimonadota bacterium]